tara:strand:- start:642 stop:1685 length:1044 start_codon:yes stop_codon:yes gene_type:complete
MPLDAALTATAAIAWMVTSTLNTTINCDAKASKGLQDLGGVSGLSQGEGADWWAVTEEQPNLFKLSIESSGKSLNVKMKEKIDIKSDPLNESLTKLGTIAFCENQLIVGTEPLPKKALSKDTHQDSRLLAISTNGDYLYDLSIPDHYKTTETTGLAYYRGFQGAACNKDGTELFIGAQLPLKQDQHPQTRILHYKRSATNKTFQLKQEYLYPVSKKLGIMGLALINPSTIAVLEFGPDSTDRNVIFTSRLPDRVTEQKSISPIHLEKQVLVKQLEQTSGLDTDRYEVHFSSLDGAQQSDGSIQLIAMTDDDHCGSVSNAMASDSPGFAGTTLSLIRIKPIATQNQGG